MKAFAKLDAAAHDRGVYLRARLAVEDTGSAGVAAVGLALEHVASNTSWPEDPTFATETDLVDPSCAVARLPKATSCPVGHCCPFARLPHGTCYPPVFLKYDAVNCPC